MRARVRRGSVTAACAVVPVAVGLALLGGCGGSASPGDGSPPPPELRSAPFYFHADSVTGEVTALPPGAPRLAGIETVSPQVVGTDTGASRPLEVQTSSKFSFTGNPGRRAVNTWIVNNLAEAVGALPGGEAHGIDLIFTSLVFRNASGALVHGGELVNPDKYDPHTKLPILVFPGRLAAGATSATRAIVFSLPKDATQVIWGVIARTDTVLPGAYPQPRTGCYVTTVAGAEGRGFADGPAHLAKFNDPYGLCVAPDGAVLIADVGNSALRELLPSGVVRTVPDLGTDLGAAYDVTIDLANSTPTSQIVYVACGAVNRVYRIVRNPTDNTTVSVTSVAGGGGSATGGTGDALMLSNPCGLAADLCNGFWLAGTGNDRVYYIRLEPGADPRTAGAARYQVVRNLTTFGDADDVAVDHSGNAFVIEDANRRIHRIDASGTVTDITIATLGVPACCVNGAVTVCYFKDGLTNTVKQLRLLGNDPKLAASWTAEKLTDGGLGYRDGAGSIARFDFGDSGLALDASGALWVTDISNGRIRRLDRLAGQ